MPVVSDLDGLPRNFAVIFDCPEMSQSLPDSITTPQNVSLIEFMQVFELPAGWLAGIVGIAGLFLVCHGVSFCLMAVRDQ